MDNKKWGKRFSTIFWWSLAILPFVIPLIQFIGYHLTFNSGITSGVDLADYHNNSIGSYVNLFKNYNSTGSISSVTYFAIGYLKASFVNVFTLMNVDQYAAQPLGNAFGYMASIFMYHVLFDVVVWLPRIFHSWLDRWCVE